MEYTAEKAFDAVARMKSGVNLGNSLDASSFSEKDFSEGKIGWIQKYSKQQPQAWEIAWKQPLITLEFIRAIKAEGFNSVRLPVTWAEHIDFKTGEINSDWMARVKEIAGWIVNEGMYCLINTHHDGGASGWVRASLSSYEKYSSLYTTVYTQIGNAFKDFSDRLILCGTNEILSMDERWGNGPDEAVEVVNKWNQLFVDTIRKTGGKNVDRNLVVGTYCNSTQESDLERFIKPKDSSENHLILDVHIYTPKEFVWTKESWLPGWTTVWNDSLEEPVKTEFERVHKYAHKKNIPVIVGEWGTLRRRFPGKTKEGIQNWEAVTDEEAAKFTKVFIKESHEKGFSCFFWAVSEMMDRETGSVKSPLMIKGIMENF